VSFERDLHAATHDEEHGAAGIALIEEDVVLGVRMTHRQGGELLDGLVADPFEDGELAGDAVEVVL
jgi:hypothetical protein